MYLELFLHCVYQVTRELQAKSSCYTSLKLPDLRVDPI